MQLLNPRLAVFRELHPVLDDYVADMLQVGREMQQLFQSARFLRRLFGD